MSCETVFDFDINRCVNPGEDGSVIHFFLSVEDGRIKMYEISKRGASNEFKKA